MKEPLSTAQDESVSPMALPAVLRQFLLWSVALTVIAFATKCICGRLLHLPAAYDYMVFPRVYFGVDFNCFRDRFHHFHHLSFFGQSSSLVFTYPAPVAIVYQVFYLVPKPLAVFLLFFATCTVVIAYRFSVVLHRRGLRRETAFIFMAATVLCSYPLIVEFFVANMEIVLGFAIGFGLYFFLKDRPWAAATCFAVAGAMKLFPFIFLALLLTQKRYKQIVYAFILAAALNIASCWLLSGSVTASWHGVEAGIDYYRLNYALPFHSLDTGIDHSLWGMIKGGIVLAGFHYPEVSTMAPLLRVYLAFTAIIGAALYFLRIRFLPALNQILTLCVISILLTPGSKGYTLMHLYVPWAMMVLVAIKAYRAREEVRGLMAAFFCMTLLLAPVCEVVARGNVLSGQIKSIFLIALLVVGLRFPFRFWEGETQDSSGSSFTNGTLH